MKDTNQIPPGYLEEDGVRKLKDRNWYDLGSRHGIENRIDDFGRELAGCETGHLSVVDIGAAEGDFSLWLSSRFAEVLTIELMDAAFSKLEAKTKAVTNIQARQLDIFEEDLPKSFDLVCFLGVLHYLTDDEKRREVLKKVVSKTNGCALVRTGFRELKVLHRENLNQLQKYTPVESLLSVAEELGMEVLLIDNHHRGRSEKRLGSLAIFYRKDSAASAGWVGDFVAEIKKKNHLDRGQIAALVQR